MEINIKTAESLYKQNKYQETIDTCNKILATDINSFNALKLIAKSFLGIREIENARLYFKKALSIKPDDYEVIKDIGNTYQAIGDINNAKNYYKKAIEINNSYAPALTNLGSIELTTGKTKEGLSLLIKATESDPKLAPAWSNLANGYIQIGRAREAEQPLRKSIALKPDSFKAHLNLGAVLQDLGKLQQAEVFIQNSIALNPNLFDSHFLLGINLLEQKKLQEAEQPLRKSIALKSDSYQAHLNLGAVLQDLGKLQQAEVFMRKAIELNPNCAVGHSNLGNILCDLGQLKEAELSTRKAIQLNPDFAMAYSNLGSILSECGQLKEAELSTRKAIQLNPEFANIHFNLGNILKDLGKLREAESSLLKAIELKPNYAEAYFNLSHIELLQGNYHNGLKNYEFRFKKKKSPPLHGNPITRRIDTFNLKKGKKLLIISEQGLGDTLQYMRYVPYLRSKGLDVSFCAQTKLHSLIQSSLIDKNPLTPEQSNLVSESEWIPLLSLPKNLQINPGNPIISEPYIFSTTELKKKWEKILTKEKKPIVAINWQGNQKMENTYKGRSIPLEKFSILAKQNKISMVSLQKGFGSEQIEECSFQNKFVKCQPQIDSTWDFVENAAIIDNCDLIITCDTSIAHLAGGMGKKVWLLLVDIPFWTWGLQGETTFWYPSMRLFRQKERHNWNEVMQRVSSSLNEEIEGKL